MSRDAILHHGLPAAVHLEITVLGAMLTDESCLHEALAGLRDADMLLDSHRRILRAMRELTGGSRAVDILTVGDLLEQRKELQAVGGLPYLSEVTEGIPRHPAISDYLRILRQKSTARSGMQACEAALRRLAEDVEDPSEVLSRLSERLSSELAGTEAGRAVTAAEHTVPELERFHEQTASEASSRGLSYGNRELDSYTHGMQPGEVTVVGARSGVGKTAMMVQAVAANCRCGVGAEIFSLEAPAGRLLRHMWAMESGVPYYKVRRPHLCTPQQSAAVKHAALRVAEWNLHIHDRSGLSVQQMVALARLGIRKHKSRLLAVDYAQIVDSEGRDDRLRVANVSKTLTRLAKEEGVSLLLLSQLAKTPREFYGREPTVNDLRETGQLENDAHVVLLLHRRFDADQATMDDRAEIIIPKIRDGEPGVIEARFCRESLRFL